MARGLGPGRHLLCCDISQEWTSIARAAWQEAGVANRIELLWVPKTLSTSRDQVIFVDRAAGASLPSDAVLLKIDRFG